ncbi:hypothetical protein ASD67_20475 [Sphingopyxis sp. Root1497]|uniref:hypothetical protein n=1 Tax=Sphingopyxis sp. Root1497 TaxID=1736474 RepID=UPI0006F54CB5|nr:hypothetical protein [Sphingopyxis sp. Root1497]KQZ61582.1 hypothetical protein ASD67_20475 [Sphingopyxis sp. Root1497]
MTLLRTMACLALMMVAAPYASASSPGSPPTEASPRGDASALQAFGDDPMWTIVVDARGMRMALDDGGEPVFRELPAPLVSQAESGRVFRTKTAAGEPVELRVAGIPCAGSSGELPLQAVLSVGSMRREGCARVLEDMGARVSRPLLGDLAVDGRIVSKGGPPGYSLDIQESGTTFTVRGRVLNLNKPVALQIANASWPTVAGNVATYALANDDETVTASATVQAANCKANGKTYLLTLALLVDGQTYRSCASQAYLTLPMLSPPTVLSPF